MSQMLQDSLDKNLSLDPSNITYVPLICQPFSRYLQGIYRASFHAHHIAVEKAVKGSRDKGGWFYLPPKNHDTYFLESVGGLPDKIVVTSSNICFTSCLCQKPMYSPSIHTSNPSDRCFTLIAFVILLSQVRFKIRVIQKFYINFTKFTKGF
jgi:hypothetical protein